MKYLDPKADLTFKKIFGNHPDRLKNLLNTLQSLNEDELIQQQQYPPSYFRKQDGGFFINGLNSVLFLCLIFEFIKSITIYANHCALADEGVWINL